MNRITISAGEVSLPAELNDSPTARQLWHALPIEGQANVWGDEIYFKIPVVADQAPDAQATLRWGRWDTGRWATPFASFSGRRR